MDFYETDLEFMNHLEYFAYDEVINEPGWQLPDDIRNMAILAVLLGCQGLEVYKDRLPKAFEAGLTPAMVKELVYQAAAYLGTGRILPFLDATNRILTARSVDLPLPGPTTVISKNRLEQGMDIQIEIFGEHIREAREPRHIQQWLTSNYFGGYYTRDGLDLKQRELITFCFLAAQGNCESQLTAHIRGNINLGNSKDFLRKVISQCLPYIGYPCCLNAIDCINKV